MILNIIQDAANKAKQQGHHPIIVFDIDDTIIDCRPRKLKVFQDFLEESHYHKLFPLECQCLSNLKLEQIQYRVSECLEKIGIQNSEFEFQLFKFWIKRYFTYSYLMMDQPFPGAEHFVTRCLELPAIVVYLTGRDEPGMGAGTRQRLEQLNFPFPHPQVHLILKPDPDLPDLEFKIEAMKEIERLGKVIAVFENEVRTLNKMAECDSEILLFHRQTLQSPNPPPPHQRIITHTSF